MQASSGDGQQGGAALQEIALALAQQTSQHLAEGHANARQAYREGLVETHPAGGGRGLLATASTASSSSGLYNAEADAADILEHHGTLRECLRDVQDIDPSRVVVIRGTSRLGFESHDALRRHFSQYGGIHRVLMAHSRVKNRMRPGNMGFVVMQTSGSVKRILSEGTVHFVADVRTRIENFSPSKMGMLKDNLDAEESSRTDVSGPGPLPENIAESLAEDVLRTEGSAQFADGVQTHAESSMPSNRGPWSSNFGEDEIGLLPATLPVNIAGSLAEEVLRTEALGEPQHVAGTFTERWATSNAARAVRFDAPIDGHVDQRRWPRRGPSR
jgi:hypothetical protein